MNILPVVFVFSPELIEISASGYNFDKLFFQGGQHQPEGCSSAVPCYIAYNFFFWFNSWVHMAGVMTVKFLAEWIHQSA